MPDIPSPTIILIGPEGAGKTTIGKILSEKLNKEVFSLDRHRKELYAPFDYDDAHADKIYEQDGVEALLKYWKYFEYRAVVDILQNALKPGDRFYGKILDFGAGHSIFENKEELDRVAELISPYKGVFLVVPCENVDEALRIMEERRGHELSYNRHFMNHPSNKTLAKHIIYTKDFVTPNTLDKPIDDMVVIDQSCLTNAILARDVDAVELMLSSGADPNARRIGKETPAWRSVDGRHIKPDRQDPSSCHELYPLDLAMTSRPDCRRIVELLLRHGADPNSRYPQTTVAHRVLERRGSDPNISYNKRNAYLDLILRHPLLDVNLQDGEGIPLLQIAFEVGDAEAARILIDRGADLRCRDDSGRNILHLVSADDCGIDLIQHIIGLEPELQYQFDKHGKTPLQYAIDCQKPGSPRDEVKLLISAGVDVTARDTNGDTPLHILFRGPFLLVADYYGDAIWQGFVKNTIDLLLSKGADINAQNEAGETSVFAYFRSSRFNVDTTWAKMDEERHNLSKKWGGDRWKVNKELEEQIVEGTEPKIWAFFDTMAVEWSVINVKGESLLHVVAGQERPFRRVARFQFLVSQGLDLMAEDMQGQTALDIAAHGKADDILALYKGSLPPDT
ncbi:hypothetical protein FPRO04_11012 [Fusarium proliferatum]|nr:hypothetical protein FPRO03_13389 [Fusarium proliferatum]KAG4271407.1 hypothetical protein FPRO04_11012 [Fusarium proliferatum]